MSCPRCELPADRGARDGDLCAHAIPYRGKAALVGGPRHRSPVPG